MKLELCCYVEWNWNLNRVKLELCNPKNFVHHSSQKATEGSVLHISD